MMPSSVSPPALEHRHIVDQLIEERATHLMARPKVWTLVKAIFYPLLGYKKAVEIADHMASLSGRKAMDFATEFLSMKVETHGLDHIPCQGPCVILSNHPGGIADGIAVWQMLRERRPDTIFFANRDAIRVCPGLADFVIPVEWRPGSRDREKTRETLKQAVTAFKNQQCIVVFPAGRMAHWDWSARALVEGPWLPTGVSLARKFKAPLIPMGLKQRMSLAFYGLGQIHDELRHMTVFYELLAKKAAKYRISLSAPIDTASLIGTDQAITDTLRAQCQTLAWHPERLVETALRKSP